MPSYDECHNSLRVVNLLVTHTIQPLTWKIINVTSLALCATLGVAS